MSLIEDALIAMERGLKFKVTRKAARGARWLTVESGIDDLEVAVQKAKAIDDYESGVFASLPPRPDGFLYWSSAHPDLLNSSVVTTEIHYPSDE